MRQAVGRNSTKKMDNAATCAPRVREQNVFLIKYLLYKLYKKVYGNMIKYIISVTIMSERTE